MKIYVPSRVRFGLGILCSMITIAAECFCALQGNVNHVAESKPFVHCVYERGEEPETREMLVTFLSP